MLIELASLSVFIGILNSCGAGAHKILFETKDSGTTVHRVVLAHTSFSNMIFEFATPRPATAAFKGAFSLVHEVTKIVK